MDIEDNERWREALRKFMKWYGINENQWCQRAGIPQSTLNMFMRGSTANITYGTLEKLAKSLGVTVGTIMGEVGMQDSARQDFEGIPDSLRKNLNPNDAKLVEQVLNLDPTQKAILSGTLKTLPDADPAKPKPNKERERK